jgi:hypothetical protein
MIRTSEQNPTVLSLISAMLTDLLQGVYENHGEVQNSGTGLAGKPGR